MAITVDLLKELPKKKDMDSPFPLICSMYGGFIYFVPTVARTKSPSFVGQYTIQEHMRLVISQWEFTTENGDETNIATASSRTPRRNWTLPCSLP